MSDTTHTFFAAASRGISYILADELRALGAVDVQRSGAGASFKGSLELGYRVCLWSRLASRVLLVLDRVEAGSAQALYDGARALAWEEHVAPEGTLAVHFNGTSGEIRNSHFGALKVKDAVVDRFRDLHGTRPSVDLENPDLVIDAHLFKSTAVISVDLSGGGLHRRGYRAETVAAPLKETLAAALLVRGGWPAIAAEGGSFVDPMCGSGTLLIEAAWMAGDRAPALERQDLGLLRWRGHEASLWQRLVAEARERAAAGRHRMPSIRGYDADGAAVQASLANARLAGVETAIHVERRPLSATRREGRPGLLATNPPYGERLSDEGGVRALHAELATQLRACFGGWRAAVLSTTPEWASSLGLIAQPEVVTNGPLECRILLGELPATAGAAEAGRDREAPRAPSARPSPADRPEARGGDTTQDRDAAAAPHAAVPGSPADGRQTAAGPGDTASTGGRGGESRAKSAPATAPPALSEGAQMFANRLRKNLRILGRWARKNEVTCFRLYDADMPEYAVAVDVYRGEPDTWAHVQEYRAPSGVDPERAATRLQEALTAIPQVLELPASRIFFKVRERKRGKAQYGRVGQGGGTFQEVREGPCTFLVNFTDYLDTGLFLDHRITRQLLGEWAAGRRFLNLFGYTGTATVHAARGGALSTTTVDMSRTYLDWAQRNLQRNGCATRVHELEAADCLQWLAQPRRERYGLIFLDPPTFSNSKRMEQDSFEVQRDHVELIRRTAQLLTDDGILVFSTNFRQFKLDEAALSGLRCQDISRQTLPRDFERNPRIHRCFRIERQ